MIPEPSTYGPTPAAVEQTDGKADEDVQRRRQRILEIAASYRSLAVIEAISEDEILGYNEYGTFD